MTTVTGGGGATIGNNTNTHKGTSKRSRGSAAESMSLIAGGGTANTEKMFSGDSGEILARMEGKWIMQHEFLYLICNS